MKSRSLAIATAVLVLTVSYVSDSFGQPVLLSDDMSVGTGWTYSHDNGTAKPDPIGAGDITEADFGFDYSAFGIPEAPNSDPNDLATSGLRLATNITGAFPDIGIAAVFEDPNFNDQYTVQVDAWLNWSPDPNTGEPGIGTTEHAHVYVGFDVADAQNGFRPAQNGAGFAFDTDGDCGNCDYILKKDNAELDLSSGQYFTMGAGFPNNQPGVDETDGPFPALFPSFDIATATSSMQAGAPPDNPAPQPAGAAGFQWVTITAEVDANALGNGTNGTLGTAKFTITNPATGQSQLIGTVDNSVDDDPNDGIVTGEAPVNMVGGIGLTFFDDFGGGPVNPNFAFVIFDNVRVFDGFLTQENADFDNSGFVDGLDFLAWQQNSGLIGGALNADGDANGDGNVDAADLAIWETQYGSPPPLSSSLASVPEPASAMLLMLGSAGLLMRRRR